MNLLRLSVVASFAVAASLTLFDDMDVRAAEATTVPAASSGDAPKPYVYVPSTVSPEWQEFLSKMPSPALRPDSPPPGDLEGWKRLREFREKDREPDVQKSLARFGPTVTPRTLGGVPVLEVKPKGWTDNHKVLVYTHGGAYTGFSAHSTLGTSALAADATGLRVISIDYTLAPIAKWPQIVDEVVAVLQALEKEGHALSDIAVFGDSAGGGLAAGAVLKMRDQGLGMPAAVVLWSPWADITETGDTYTTLKAAEPTYFYDRALKNSAAAYADPADQKNPYVSPVYADFAKGFPPTLIQGGTKEIFLSNFVRLYQALDAAGRDVKLDLYEGMPHVFQPKLPDSPESQLATGKIRAFLEKHLSTTSSNEPGAKQVAPSLTGAWQLIELNGKPVAGKDIDAEFDLKERRAFGSTGVNRWNGGFEATNQTFKFGPIMSTMRGAGPPEAMRLEHEFTQSLEKATAFEFTGSGASRRLKFLTGDQVVLIFQPAAKDTPR